MSQTVREFPKPISLFKLMGPSFIILALGLGSGEVILWPYLTSNYGLGIIWGALVGITFQYFMNMEIARYALIKGESVFVGLSKMYKRIPYWFIASTFLGFGLPGIIAASAHVLANVLGLGDFKWLAAAMLILIGLILSIGKTVYSMMEHITKTVIFIGVPFIFLLTIYIAKGTDWLHFTQGFVGRGDGYFFLPAGISLATFLAAFAYSGAGGNLNLSQSIYVKEKGYGMGKYAQKISGLFRAGCDQQNVKLKGERFAITPESISRFRVWWQRVNIEHLVVFWFTGLLSMCLLMLLSYSTTYHLLGDKQQGITFLLQEGLNIGYLVAPWIGTLFLIVVAVMLFQTQLGVLDSTSRIMAENLALRRTHKKQQVNLTKIYFSFVWAQIAFGIILFAFNIYEPKTLIIVGAVINALAMFVHLGLVQRLNKRLLPKVFQPAWWRKAIIALIFVFFGIFSLVTLWSEGHEMLSWFR